MTKNGAVSVPSPCNSWNFLPFASTSIGTGEKNPGMAEDASRMSRNSRAPCSPCAAIAPMFQITRRPASRFVVATHRRRPRACSAAISDSRVGVTRCSIKRLSEHRVTPTLLSEIAAEHARGRRLWVATTNLDAGRRVIWNMGAIAAHGEQGARLFRDILLASSAIPGFFSPVPIEVEANGKKFQELHGDGTLTAPFFVMPETMLSARSTSRPPLGQLYVMVNSKLGPEFKMPDHNIPGVLGRSIGVALTAALRAELMLIYVGAQRQGIALRVAHVDPSFDFPSRGPFDGKYMQALYEVGVAAGKKGTAFGDTVPELSMRGSSSQQ